LDPVENRLLVLDHTHACNTPKNKEKKEKTDEVEHSDKIIKRKFEWNMQDIWDTSNRRNLQIMGIEEGQEVQNKYSV
jgi:hypothetical protein